MTSLSQQMKDSRQQGEIQSFYEPALHLIRQIFERKKKSLLSKGYDEKNAAVSKEELTQLMMRQFRITQWLAQQIIASLVKADLVQAFGGYVKPKDSET
ncbi:hypothetical protein [Acinetobacter higginsii]|uniref:hypothetical protein n=1 Tax=Acinetobacter higginsii TaxID=70347 RepID=UPI001F4B3659|nr:hypothetical protein [Acinetobacter higginsii]MCH7338176.1 hypothetical protein [Acinetobacter higginsii]